MSFTPAFIHIRFPRFPNWAAGRAVPAVVVDPLLRPFDAALICLPSIHPVAEVREHKALTVGALNHDTSLKSRCFARTIGDASIFQPSYSTNRFKRFMSISDCRFVTFYSYSILGVGRP
jgi:hypothetical protein